MLKHAKRNLILLYTISTGMILTLVIGLLFYSSIKQAITFEKNIFQNAIFSVNYFIQNETDLTHSQLSEIENQTHVMIDIQEIDPSYKGSLSSKTNREFLFKTLKNELNKIVIAVNLFEDSVYKNPIVTIKGEKHDYYYGTSLTFPNEKETIYILYYLDFSKIISLKTVLTYIFIEVIGLLLLFLLSNILVKKALIPIDINIQKQKEFVAAASHELKSPLAVIQANASAIKFEPSQASFYIKGILNECQRMSRLIQDMLFLASNDSHRWTIKKELIDTETFLIETYETHISYCHEKKQILTLDLPKEELPPFHADKERLSQVLAILLDNAISYSPAKSVVTIRSFIQNDSIVFDIEDHGLGIPNTAKEYIFDRFYRADPSRSDKKHVGLGLSIALEIVKLHNGKISLKDTVHGGCTFSVELPIE
ncbi:HAMP domain-containing sensor histidine kinase [Bacillus sp. FJAT-52991]|uniref:histidine kinase n=1 Tax=Bacillus kandeliae TaxID=3129297 RepID=A0ABZ2N1U4_9BACI